MKLMNRKGQANEDGDGCMNIVIPLAGPDANFERRGAPKALTDVDGLPIIAHIARGRPYSLANAIFILLREQGEKYSIDKRLRAMFGDDIHIVWAEAVTEGAPQSILLTKGLIDSDEPLLIDLADQHLDLLGFMDFISSTPADGVIPTFESSYFNRGYMRYDARGRVVVVSEKDPIPISSHSTACISYFRQGRQFVRAAEAMIKKKRRAANGAYLVSLAYNEMIEQGLDVRPFACEFIATLGTVQGADSFPQLERPLKSRREILAAHLRAAGAVAHRGATDATERQAENSIPAIRAALRAGLLAETDARRTRDGRWALSHDANTGRLMNKDLIIEKSKWAELAGLSFKAGGGAMAGLEQALDELNRLEIGGLAIHIKEAADEKALSSLAGFITARRLANRVFLFGNDENSQPLARAARQLSPPLLAALHYTAGQPAPGREQMENADLLWVDEPAQRITPELIKLEHAAGRPVVVMSPELLDVVAGTEKMEKRWAELRRMGADAICTDYALRLKKILRR